MTAVQTGRSAATDEQAGHDEQAANEADEVGEQL
jgi:hypothetical protein